MQRVNNYGSFWQAYCLKQIIENDLESFHSNTVEFIDIIPGKEDTRTKFKPSFSLEKLKKIPYYIHQKKKKKIFANSQREVLGCSNKANYKADYDAIIIGSDEVFNFVQKSPWGFSPQLYGNIKNNHVSSYAACFGFTTLFDIEKYGVSDTIRKALSNLRQISVRDQNSADIVERLTGIIPEIHLDPVLVGDLPNFSLSADVLGRYILVYSYDFRLTDINIIKQVKSLARKSKCKIYSVGFYQEWCDKNIIVNPKQLIDYFFSAQYIVTDTFHGTIFSACCHKKFVTVIRDTNKHKLHDLLLRLNMLDRLVTNQDNIEQVLVKDIDYDSFEKLRQNEHNRTKEYLRKCLSKKKQIIRID